MYLGFCKCPALHACALVPSTMQGSVLLRCQSWLHVRIVRDHSIPLCPHGQEVATNRWTSWQADRDCMQGQTSSALLLRGEVSSDAQSDWLSRNEALNFAKPTKPMCSTSQHAHASMCTSRNVQEWGLPCCDCYSLARPVELV